MRDITKLERDRSMMTIVARGAKISVYGGQQLVDEIKNFTEAEKERAYQSSTPRFISLLCIANHPPQSWIDTGWPETCRAAANS
jgi:hypothetical protein